ncbi:MAG TPA: hypothetical protein VMV58_04495 [Desulfosporosinus sp.]|nr:hypothetical protein [Desulfosporosinus sp.]
MDSKPAKGEEHEHHRDDEAYRALEEALTGDDFPAMSYYTA